MTQAQHPWQYQLEDLVYLREHATTGTRPLYRVDGLRLTHLRHRALLVEIGLTRHRAEPGLLVWVGQADVVLVKRQARDRTEDT